MLVACKPSGGLEDSAGSGGGDGAQGGGGGGSAGGSGGDGTGGHLHPHPDAAAPTTDAPDDAMAPYTPPSPATVAIAGQLAGAFLEVDCASAEIEFQFCHPKDKGIENVPLTFGGEAGKNYAVVLEVWAVVEGVKYKNGFKASEYFYIGGESGTPGTAEYGLVVGTGDTAATYHLNHFDNGAGEHYTYGIHYVTRPIKVAGKSPLMLFVHDPDDYMNTNHMDSEASNPPPALMDKLTAIHAHPPEGQFIYIEVKSADVIP